MSDDIKPYSQLAAKAWTFLSFLVAATFLGMLVFGDDLLSTGQWIWDLLRYLFSPII